MLLATTLKGVTPALATLDTRAMDFPAQVSTGITKDILILLLMFISLEIISCSENHGYQVILQLK